jgi:hypothetical protein
MAEKITDREIYVLLDQAHLLFHGKEGATEGGDAVIKMFQANTDLIQRAMLLMLSERNRPQSEIGS